VAHSAIVQPQHVGSAVAGRGVLCNISLFVLDSGILTPNFFYRWRDTLNQKTRPDRLPLLTDYMAKHFAGVTTGAIPTVLWRSLLLALLFDSTQAFLIMICIAGLSQTRSARKLQFSGPDMLCISCTSTNQSRASSAQTVVSEASNCRSSVLLIMLAHPGLLLWNKLQSSAIDLVNGSFRVSPEIGCHGHKCSAPRLVRQYADFDVRGEMALQECKSELDELLNIRVPM
jgi:hypothetical protein